MRTQNTFQKAGTAIARSNIRKGVAAATILVLLVFCLLSIARLTAASNPGPDYTLLEVRESVAQPTWSNSRAIHSLHDVTFRWKTDVPNTAYVEWQMLDYKPQPNGMFETPFATHKIAKPPSGQFQQFVIDFAQIQQQNPTKIPANAPATPKDYYIRLVPWTSGGTPAVPISDVVRITYVKSSQPPSEPLNFIFVAEFWTGGHFVDIGYGTNKPVVPLITVSTTAPVTDAKGNPSFPKNAAIVSSSLPFLGGYEKDGEVELNNLKPKTHYHYIVEAKDEKGQFAYKTGQFTTAKRFVEVAFEKIFMIDDSDGFPSGAGDMNFAFFVNDANVVGKDKTIPERGQTMDFSTGETKTFNVLKILEDPPNNVRVRVNGSDQDDCGDVLHHPLCNCVSGGGEGHIVTDPHMTNHTCKDGSGEQSAATDTLNIPDVTDRSQFGVEFLQEPFTMTADNRNLKFKVSGSFTVRYH